MSPPTGLEILLVLISTKMPLLRSYGEGRKDAKRFGVRRQSGSGDSENALHFIFPGHLHLSDSGLKSEELLVEVEA